MQWLKALGLAMLAEVLLVVSAVLYMVVYGYVIHPGEKAEFYEAHVKVAGPWLTIPVGLVVFYLLSRWVRSWGVGRVMVFWGIWFALDVAILLGSDGVEGIVGILPFFVASVVTKAGAAWMGARG